MHSGGTLTISAVVFSEVTTTQAIGSSQSTASASNAAVSTTRAPSTRRRTSVFRMTAEQPKLEDREDQDDGEQDPRHGRRGAELEEVLERGLVEMLHDRPRGIARAAAGEDEDLPEELEGADDVRHDDEEQHGTQQRQRERKEEHAAQHGPEGAAVERESEPERDDEDRERAGDRVEGRVRQADVKARVVEQACVVRGADVGERRATEPRVRERQPQALEQRVDAEDHEQ